MGSDLVDVSYKAFDDCRQRVRTAVKQFDMQDVMTESKSKTPPMETDGKIFGNVAFIDKLLGLVDTTSHGVQNEIEIGNAKLKSVENALDQVETNLRAAEKASGA